MIDSSGSVVDRFRYDGYGTQTIMDSNYTIVGTASVNQSYGYAGRRHDAENVATMAKFRLLRSNEPIPLKNNNGQVHGCTQQSGLQYYRARYFDNDQGWFINRDPIGYVDGMNLYRGYFVCNAMDPSGLLHKECGPLTSTNINFDIGPVKAKATLFSKEYCCANDDTSLVKNRKRKKKFYSIDHTSVEGEGSASIGQIKKKIKKEVLKSISNKSAKKIIGELIELLDIDLKFDLNVKASLTAHYDGCRESITSVGGNVQAEASISLEPQVNRDGDNSFGFTLSATGIIKSSYKKENKTIKLKDGTGEIRFGASYNYSVSIIGYENSDSNSIDDLYTVPATDIFKEIDIYTFP